MQQAKFESCQAYKESGVFKSWTEKLLYLDLQDKILTYSDIKARTNKILNVNNYMMKNIGVHSGKWALQFKVKEDIQQEPRIAKFGWNTETEQKKWANLFTIKIELPKKLSPEWDMLSPGQEIIATETINQILVKTAKPSVQSRIKSIIPTLPQFFQNDFEIILEKTLDNLKGFSDIENLNLIVDKNFLKVYQDPNDQLHMKMIYYSMMPPSRVYDEVTMPTLLDPFNPTITQYSIFPTKKDCYVIQAEFDLNLNKDPHTFRRNKSYRDTDELQDNKQYRQSQSHIGHHVENNKIKIVFTQKHFAVDGLYCLIRKYTGQEQYHNQIDKSHNMEDFKIKRSVMLIQQSEQIFLTNKFQSCEKYKSHIIEDLQLECFDVEQGEQLIKLLLGSMENLDKILFKADQYIEKETENVIVKNHQNYETLQISFRIPESEITRITSEQHQIQSKDEYMQIINIAKENQHILKSIISYHNQDIVPGLNKQLCIRYIFFQKLESNKEDGHFVLGKYYYVDEQKGGLIFTNKVLVKNQRSVIFDMIKRMGSNLLSGKSIMAVSLPIQIFEPRSFLERMARSFGHAPHFLEQATNDKLEQMKLVISFCMSSFMMGIQQEKPFNPIIGETFQGRILGCPVYLEQTSHHPPISNYIMYGRGYKYYGSLCPIVNLGTNSLSGEQHGHGVVQFSNNNLKFYYIWQPFTVYNITIGQRNVNCHKRSYCFQPDSQILCEIQYNPKDERGGFFSQNNQKIDHFRGKIMKVTKECIQRCQAAHKTNSGLTLKLKIKPHDIIETLGNTQGRWTQYIEFDGKKYWQLEQFQPYVLELEANPLPSDCIFRSDVLYMKMKDLIKGQDVKEEMEQKQRQDNILRAKKGKK